MQRPEEPVRIEHPEPLLNDLRALARAVTLDATVDVQLDARARGWATDGASGVIFVPSRFVLENERDEVLGRLCVEAAQLAITRFGAIVPPALLAVPGRKALLATLEFCRATRWLTARFAGLDGWARDAVEATASALASRDDLPRFLQFCLAALVEGRGGETPRSLDADVLDALAQTRDARRRFVEMQPPTAPVSSESADRYDRSPVRAVFERDDAVALPDEFERAVRVLSFDAWCVFWREINPAYEPLVDGDRCDGCDCDGAEGSLCDRLPDCSARRRPRRRPLRRRATGALPSMVGSQGACESPSPEDFTPAHGALSEPDEHRRMLERLHEAPSDAYGEARSHVAELIDTLARELERVIRPESYPRWLPGYATGAAIDMRAAMRFEADPATYSRLWKRKTIPRKRDWRFVLLLDLSGSMDGDKTVHAFRGVVLTTEVLARLGVSFAVHGFQDVLIPFKDFAEPLDESTRARIGTMPLEVKATRPQGRNNPGDNFDGPVLHALASRLEAESGSPKVLIVLSDGEPSGPDDGSVPLRNAIQAITARGEILLVGVGIGPETEHVRRYYPDAIANVPLETFAQQLGACIERHLLA